MAGTNLSGGFGGGQNGGNGSQPGLHANVRGDCKLLKYDIPYAPLVATPMSSVASTVASYEEGKNYMICMEIPNGGGEKTEVFESQITYTGDDETILTVVDNKGKTQTLKDIVSQGYRWESEEDIKKKSRLPWGGERLINRLITYTKHIGLVKIVDEKNVSHSYDGYLVGGRSYAVNPKELFLGLGISAQDIDGTPLDKYVITVGAKTVDIKKAICDKYTLDNVWLGDVRDKLIGLIGYEFNWDGSTETVTFTKRETIEIATWLTGYKGRPTAPNGTVITYSLADWNKLLSIPGVNPATVDWYSYENLTGPTPYTAPYLPSSKFAPPQVCGELRDTSGMYWASFGPKVFYPNYPDTGTLDISEFKGFIGCRVDAILHHDKENYDAYIECVFDGDPKAHTYNNGIFQTGYPYPNSSNAKTQPYQISYVNGSIVEFMGLIPKEHGSDNGIMSNFHLVELIVYK